MNAGRLELVERSGANAGIVTSERAWRPSLRLAGFLVAVLLSGCATDSDEASNGGAQRPTVADEPASTEASAGPQDPDLELPPLDPEAGQSTATYLDSPAGRTLAQVDAIAKAVVMGESGDACATLAELTDGPPAQEVLELTLGVPDLVLRESLAAERSVLLELSAACSRGDLPPPSLLERLARIRSVIDARSLEIEAAS